MWIRTQNLDTRLNSITSGLRLHLFEDVVTATNYTL